MCLHVMSCRHRWLLRHRACGQRHVKGPTASPTWEQDTDYVLIFGVLLLFVVVMHLFVVLCFSEVILCLFLVVLLVYEVILCLFAGP